MEFMLIRHAQPEWIRNNRNVVNPPLTELGHAQAERLAKVFGGDSFDELYVSPLTRARQTAEPVLATTGHDEAVEPWLEEIRDPDWHGEPSEGAIKAFRALRERVAMDQWNGLPGGEPMHEFVARVRVGGTEFLERKGIRPSDGELPVWQIEDPHRRIGLIAHGGTNSVFACLLLGLTPTPWEWDRIVMRHASISRIVALPIGDGFVFSLSSLSDVEHLEHDQRTA